MSDVPALRASDADRERAIVLLREHAVAGRLTLEEFTDRMSAASRAVTKAELDELARDLPAASAPVATSRRGPTRFAVSLFGSSEDMARSDPRDPVRRPQGARGMKSNLTSGRLQSFRNDCNQVETWLRGVAG